MPTTTSSCQELSGNNKIPPLWRKEKNCPFLWTCFSKWTTWVQDENSHSIPEHINLQAQPLVGQILPYLHSAVSMHISEYCPAVAPSSAEGFRLWIAEAGLIQTKWTATSRGRAWWEDNKPILSSPPPPFFSSFLSFFPFFFFFFIFPPLFFL